MKNPSCDCKWLPLKMKSKHEPHKFIEVPVSIINWNQIRSVLDQIRSLKNRQMIEWHSIFGNVSKEEAFGYVLGMLVSDSGKELGRLTSTSLRLKLSSRYKWSKRVGSALCYYLGKFGIKASETGEENGSNTVIQWRSENSPLISWMMYTCLGLARTEQTSINPIKADWMLKAPHIIRLRFLQGINDGDGCACVKSQEITVCSSANISFIMNLLATFEIETYSSPRKGVSIKKQKGIIRAAKLPFFLHATERQSKAETLLEMMQERKNQRYKPLDDRVIDFMRKLRADGMSDGSIAEGVFNKYKISKSRSSIRNYLLKSTS
jgi:hypothetical protein